MRSVVDLKHAVQTEDEQIGTSSKFQTFEHSYKVAIVLNLHKRKNRWSLLVLMSTICCFMIRLALGLNVLLFYREMYHALGRSHYEDLLFLRTLSVGPQMVQIPRR